MNNPDNFVNGYGIPMGLGMALAQNSKAMENFSSLPEEKRKSIIEGTHNISSKQEMEAYVNSLANQGFKG